MKRQRFLCGSFAVWFVLSLSVNPAIADTPGTCPDVTGTPCSSGGICTINVSETGGNTTVDKAVVVVQSGTRIEWSTSSGSFIVTFATSHPFHPTTAGTFAGTRGHNSGDTANVPPGHQVCYQYSVEHCGNGHCATIDPKVIVTNVRDRR